MVKDVYDFCAEKCELEFEDNQPPCCDECDKTEDIQFERNEGTTVCRECFDDLFYEYNKTGKDKLWNNCIVPTKRTWHMVEDFPTSLLDEGELD